MLTGSVGVLPLTHHETTTKDSKTETYNYDVFGESIGKTPEFFGYTGKPFDPQTKMYNYGYRDYTPKSARFSTIDPVRDGANWYGYVGQDPVNRIDRLGLSASDNLGIDYSKTINQKLFNLDGPLSIAYDTTETWTFPSGSFSKHDYIGGGLNSDLSLRVGVGKWDPSHAFINADLGLKIGGNLSVAGNLSTNIDFDSYNQTKLGISVGGNLSKGWDFSSPNGNLSAKIDLVSAGSQLKIGVSTDFANTSLSAGASLLSGTGNVLNFGANVNISNGAVSSTTLNLAIPLGSANLSTSLSVSNSGIQNTSLGVSVPLGGGALNISTSGSTPLSVSYNLTPTQNAPATSADYSGLLSGIASGIETANQVWGWLQ